MSYLHQLAYVGLLQATGTTLVTAAGPQQQYVSKYLCGSNVTQLRTTTRKSEFHKLTRDWEGASVPSVDNRLIFVIRRLQAHTKTTEKLTRELLFGDDAALVVHTESAMQRISSCFAEAAQLFGLKVSLKKTEVLHQPAPQEEYHQPSISIVQSELKAVHQFS